MMIYGKETASAMPSTLQNLCLSNGDCMCFEEGDMSTEVFSLMVGEL